MSAPLTVACLGVGYFGQFHIDAWQRISDVDLVGVADIDLKKATETGVRPFENLSDMLDQITPDILDIITPPHTHLEAIKYALNVGVKTIICQKPFCQSIAQVEEAIHTAAANGAKLIVHENFRFQPWYRVMRQAIDDGLLGTIHQMTFRLRTGDGQGPKAYLERQPYFQKMERFLVHETAVHWVDTFQYLLGPAQSVYADLRKQNPTISGEDAGHIIFEMPNGVRAIFDGNRHLDHSTNNTRLTFGEALLEGSAGTIELIGDGSVSFRKFGEQKTEVLLAAKTYRGFAGDCVYQFQNHIVSAFLHNTKLETLAADYLNVLRLEQAIYQSDETHSRVSVSP